MTAAPEALLLGHLPLWSWGVSWEFRHLESERYGLLEAIFLRCGIFRS